MTASAAMRWFSDDYHHGELSDAARESAAREYRRHVRRLGQEMPALQGLLGVNLHDGRVLSVQPTGIDLAVSYLTGDLQVGYQVAEITYHQCADLAATARRLSEVLADKEDIVSDEVDLADGLVTHRLWVWDSRTIAIAFSGVSIALREGSADLRR